jgi:hypothetical protein
MRIIIRNLEILMAKVLLNIFLYLGLISPKLFLFPGRIKHILVEKIFYIFY